MWNACCIGNQLRNPLQSCPMIGFMVSCLLINRTVKLPRLIISPKFIAENAFVVTIGEWRTTNFGKRQLHHLPHGNQKWPCYWCFSKLQFYQSSTWRFRPAFPSQPESRRVGKEVPRDRKNRIICQRKGVNWTWILMICQRFISFYVFLNVRVQIILHFLLRSIFSYAPAEFFFEL